MTNKRWMLVLLAFPGCIRDAGECWVRGEDTGGVGGGVIVGAGAGGFGDVPPEPQNEPASSDPCIQAVECEVTWKADAEACESAAPGPGATCKTYYRGRHRSLEEAKTECERILGVGANSNVKGCEPCYWVQATNNDCMEHCKDKCVEVWEGCDAGCGKDHVCKEKCVNALVDCLKQCERKCK